jgi:LacI family transcriptional regulator
MKKTSLKDIANRVGVSTALVSYVLNNKKEGRISKDVAQRIRDTARLLRYRTNQVARSLKTNKTYTIGLIVADISNPFFSMLARIIEDVADESRYTVIFGSSDENTEKFEKLIETFLNRQVDGLIIAPPANAAAQVKYLQEQDMPFVLVDRYFPELETHHVGIDNYAAAFEAVQHLIETGRRKIALVSFDPSIYTIAERRRGYVAALEQNAVIPGGALIKELNTDSGSDQVEQVIDELLSDPNKVDAILFGSNILAAKALKYINTLSIIVPDDLAIISFDETAAFDLFYSPITFIRQPLQEMGRLATKILFDTMSTSQSTVQISLPATLVMRDSTRAMKRRSV